MSLVHSPPHRAIRAALFAVVCVSVAAVLHSVAGGARPSWPELAVGIPAVWLVAWPTLGRERSGLELTAGLGAAQIGLHYLFTYLCAATATQHHAVAASTALTPSPFAMSMPDMPNMDMSGAASHPSGAAMFAAHVLAVLVCGWWLRQGERDFFALCRVVAVLFAAPLRRLADAIAALCVLARVSSSNDEDVPHRLYSLPDDGLRHCSTPLLTAVTFRGPPVLA